MKRYILWDHDGVLVDTEPCYFEATRAALAAVGVELPRAGYLRDMAALSRFDAGAAEAVVVEDSERGLRSAQAAGIDCAVVRNAFVHGQDFSGARALIDDLSELPGVLATL